MGISSLCDAPLAGFLFLISPSIQTIHAPSHVFFRQILHVGRIRVNFVLSKVSRSPCIFVVSRNLPSSPMGQQSASCPPFARQCVVLACSQVVVVCASSFFRSFLAFLFQPVIKSADTLVCVVSVGERHPALSKSGRKRTLTHAHR